jgi:predicted nucleic acid-binding protein
VSDSISFLDTSVLLRHYLQDHEDQSPRAKALIRAILRGERSVQIADTVVFETVYVLEKSYRVPRALIRDLLQEFLDMPGVLLPGKRIYRAVFANYTARLALSFADCFHLELAKHLAQGNVIAFDRKMGTVEGIVREEP